MKLRELCKIKHGFAFKGKDIIKDHPTKYILVTPGNFNIGGGFKADKCKYFSEEGEIPQDYILNENDLIVTMTDLSVKSDTLGYSALVPHSDYNIYLHNQRIGLVTDIDESKITKDYLYWFMRTNNYQRRVVASQSGTAIHHTSPDRILDIDITLPSIEEQKKITKVLFDFDDKIDINCRINDNLYKLGLNILREKTVNSETKKELKNFFDVRTGKKDANASVDNGDYPFFTCSQQISYIDSYSYDGPAILLAGNGDFNVKVYDGKFDAYQRTYVLMPFDSKYLGYLYFAISDNLNDITSSFRGSVIKFITKNMIEDYKIPYVEDEKIYNLLNNIIYQIMQNEEENKHLSQLRNTILPKIIGGEIKVDNIEL